MPSWKYFKFWKFLQKYKPVLYTILSLYQKVSLRLVYNLQKKEKSSRARQHAAAYTLAFQKPVLKQQQQQKYSMNWTTVCSLTSNEKFGFFQSLLWNHLNNNIIKLGSLYTDTGGQGLLKNKTFVMNFFFYTTISHL